MSRYDPALVVTFLLVLDGAGPALFPVKDRSRRPVP